MSHRQLRRRKQRQRVDIGRRTPGGHAQKVRDGPEGADGDVSQRNRPSICPRLRFRLFNGLPLDSQGVCQVRIVVETLLRETGVDTVMALNLCWLSGGRRQTTCSIRRLWRAHGPAPEGVEQARKQLRWAAPRAGRRGCAGCYGYSTPWQASPGVPGLQVFCEILCLMPCRSRRPARVDVRGRVMEPGGLHLWLPGRA